MKAPILKVNNIKALYARKVTRQLRYKLWVNTYSHKVKIGFQKQTKEKTLLQETSTLNSSARTSSLEYANATWLFYLAISLNFNGNVIITNALVDGMQRDLGIRS